MTAPSRLLIQATARKGDREIDIGGLQLCRPETHESSFLEENQSTYDGNGEEGNTPSVIKRALSGFPANAKLMERSHRLLDQILTETKYSPFVRTSHSK